MGVVYHGRYFPWLECARVELLDHLGYPYREMESDGVRMPVLEVSCRFLAPATFDDRLQVKLMVREPPTARLVIEYEIRRGGDLLCQARTAHSFINRSNRPCRPPARFRQLFQAHFQAGQGEG